MTAITANKTFQYWDKVSWTELPKGSFKDAEALGFPIRVLWKSGSFKVIRNLDKLPKDAAVKQRVEAKPKAEPKIVAKAVSKIKTEPKPKVAAKPKASTDNAEIKALLVQLLKKLG